MSISRWVPVLASGAIALAACGAGNPNPPGAAAGNVASKSEVPSVTFAPAREARVSAKPSGPISIAYQVIGKPVVGEPLAIDLRVSSAVAVGQVDISYRIGDPTALRLADSQPASTTLSHAIDDATGAQQVSVVPLREGRVYLNVSATVQTADGSVSTVSAIPIQVGGSGSLKLQENGKLHSDSEGNAVRVLQGSDK